MKPETNRNISVFVDSALTQRISGFFLIAAGLGLAVLCRQIAKYFTSPEQFASQIVLIVVFAAVGILIGFLGFVLLKIPAKTLILNSTLGKIFYEEKYFFRTVKDEINFSEVYEITQETMSLENGDFYTCYIVVRGGRQIEIPSKTSGDKTRQDALCQQVRNFIGVE